MKQMEEWASAALNQVLETMFYATIEPKQEQEPGEFFYQGTVDLLGQSGGYLKIQLSKRLAQILAGNFCGTEPDQLSEPQVSDVVKEFTNMVAGSFVALAVPSLGAVSLSVPDVATVDRQSGVEELSPGGVALEFEVEEEDLALLVSLREG